MKIVNCVVIVFVLCFVTWSLSADVIGKTDEEVRGIVEPMLDNILEGMKVGDYNKYSKDFDDTTEEAVSEKRFLEFDSQVKKHMGNYLSREYLGFLTKTGMTIVLWKAQFDKTEEDILIKLVISKKEDRYLITGLWFQ